MGDTYGPNGEFRRIPRKLQMEMRRRAIFRWVRKNRQNAIEKLKEGKIYGPDVFVVVCALKEGKW